MTYLKQFGVGAAMSKELFYYIRNTLEIDKIILELGSGWTSGELSKFYAVYSVEDNQQWLNKFKTHYIHAPIKNGWFDIEVFKKQLPSKYDLIIVDGPAGHIGRSGFFKNLDLFNTNIPIIFDDVNRKSEYDLMCDVAKKLNRTYTIFPDSKGGQFGVV